MRQNAGIAKIEFYRYDLCRVYKARRVLKSIRHLFIYSDCSVLYFSKHLLPATSLNCGPYFD